MTNTNQKIEPLTMNQGCVHVWPHMVRIRAGGEENEAYGPLESEGEIDSVNFQGQNQLIVPVCSSESCSKLKTGY